MADLGTIATASQDVVFSAWAFSYVDDLFACFAEVRRVLKPTGVFVWSTGRPLDHVLKETQARRERLLPWSSEPCDTGAVFRSRFLAVDV
jgi:ubiquinone/menaquinone biosynthesis C-methylase UbiE